MFSERKSSSIIKDASVLEAELTAAKTKLMKLEFEEEAAKKAGNWDEEIKKHEAEIRKHQAAILSLQNTRDRIKSGISSEKSQIAWQVTNLEKRLKNFNMRYVHPFTKDGNQEIPSECQKIWTDLSDFCNKTNNVHMRNDDYIIGELNLLEPDRAQIVFPKKRRYVSCSTLLDIIKRKFEVPIYDKDSGDVLNKQGLFLYKKDYPVVTDEHGVTVLNYNCSLDYASNGAKFCILNEEQLAKLMQDLILRPKPSTVPLKEISKADAGDQKSEPTKSGLKS